MVHHKTAATKSNVQGTPGAIGKKRRNDPNHLVFKTSVRRILQAGKDKPNAVQSGTYKILDQMCGQVQTQIMAQVARLNNTNRKRKQTKQPGLKAYDLVNATMTLIDDPAERARIRHKVQEALRNFHTYVSDEEEEGQE